MRARPTTSPTWRQQTLFDLPEQHQDSPSLIKMPDEVYELMVKVQFDCATGNLAVARQITSALTDELLSWHLRHAGPSESEQDRLIESELRGLVADISYWREPF